MAGHPPYALDTDTVAERHPPPKDRSPFATHTGVLWTSVGQPGARARVAELRPPPAPFSVPPPPSGVGRQHCVLAKEQARSERADAALRDEERAAKERRDLSRLLEQAESIKRRYYERQRASSSVQQPAVPVAERIRRRTGRQPTERDGPRR